MPRFSELRSALASQPPQPVPTVKEPSPPFVYFTGELAKVGRYSWTNGMTLKDGIDLAGGFTRYALQVVDLVHPDRSRERYALKSGWAPTNNPTLLPGDLVHSRGMRVDHF